MEKVSRREFLFISGKTVLASSIAGQLFFSSCSRKEEKKKTNLTDFVMQSAWVNDAEFMGYFVAIENKYYENEGLNLKYLPGGPEVIPEGTLLTQNADIALTTPDTTIQLMLEEKAPLKIIGAQYQKSPLGVVSLKKNNITEPNDLIDKTLAVPPVNVLSVEAMLKINNIPRNKVKIVPYQYDPTPLIKGEVDATIDFITNVPYTVKSKSGLDVSSFLLYDYGFTIFNDAIVVTEETLDRKSEIITKWLKASRKGWEENFKDTTLYPKRFMNSFFKNTGRTLENEVFFNNQQKPLIESPNGIFSMSEASIDANIQALNKIGLKATRSMFVNDLLKGI